MSESKKYAELHFYICAAVCLRLSRVGAWLKAIGQVCKLTYNCAYSAAPALDTRSLNM